MTPTDDPICLVSNALNGPPTVIRFVGESRDADGSKAESRSANQAAELPVYDVEGEAPDGTEEQ